MRGALIISSFRETFPTYLFYLRPYWSMALVSYVDILEVVGELSDFKAKLVEGEQIAQRGGVTNLAVLDIERGVWNISALCQSTSGTSDAHSVSVSVVHNPHKVDCQCSCLNGKSGKCQHVVATLMHIHRNNVSSQSCRSSGLDAGFRTKAEPFATANAENESCCVSSHPTIKVEPAIAPHAIEAASPEWQEISELQGDYDVLNEVDAEVERAKTVETQIGMDEEEIGVPPRLGRGQRKAIPNPKYYSELKRFSCSVCSRSFGKKAYLDAHAQSHCGEKPYMCDICGQCYSQKRSLLKHKEAIGKYGCKCKPTTTLDCKTCNLVFQSQTQLDGHLVIHREDQGLSSLNCGKSVFERDTHGGIQGVADMSGVEIKSVDKGNKLICDVCGKAFKTLARLTSHQQTHLDKKPFMCIKCGRSFSHQRTFKAHKHEKPEDIDAESMPAATLQKKRPVIKCETCGKEFTNRVHHEEHVRSHTGERPFQCVVCGKGFATKRSLRNHSHSEKNARNRPHICAQCPASFMTGSMLKIHEKVHTGEKPFSCSDCGKSYRSQHVYQDHLNHHKGIKAHTCKECGKSFTWRTSLWAHSREHAKSKPFECVQCGVKFAEQSELKDHWEMHREDKPFQCPECGLGFMIQEDCDKHTEIHKNVPSHDCNWCIEKFFRADELRRHMLTHKEKKKCLCPTCGQTFSSKGHLKVHMQIHTGEKPFECETCHKRFYTRSLMRKHAVFHSNERPFECALCGDKFPTQGILRAHVRTHTGERPYSCEKCGKSFPQSTYLKRHLLTHSGERPFPCLDCDNAFLSRYDLKIHMRTHTGEKPFVCDECNEQFYERAQLTAHQRSHTGERPYSCDLCGKGFNSSNHIKKHFGRVHPDTAPFSCTDCGERFLMCEALRKHKKSAHVFGVDTVKRLSNVNDIFEDDNPSSQKKDALNRLIEDSQILVDEISNSSCASGSNVDSHVLTQEFQIVQVNVVESSQLIKLPEGFKCETVEVFHAESLVEFEENSELEAVSITTIDKEDVAETTKASVVLEAENSSSSGV